MHNYSCSIKPVALLQGFVNNRQLVCKLASRDIVARYKGSVLGMLWSFVNPVFMLAVYTFVFSVVFQARWHSGIQHSRAEFALNLFIGLIIFNLFAECVTKAPELILHNVNYVKKVVFPLETLPWVSVTSALFNALVSFVVWLLFALFVFGLPPVTSLYLPLILLPLLLFTLGLTWLLASLGVYLRDVAQVINILVTAMMFLTPIFYPISAIPQPYRHYVYINPLTIIVEQARALLIQGQVIHWGGYVISLVVSAVIAWLGFAWFQKTRKGFADVL